MVFDYVINGTILGYYNYYFIPLYFLYSDFVNLISDDEGDINWDDEKQLQAAIDASLLESNPTTRSAIMPTIIN